MQMIGRFAESEDPVLFARFGEVDKCEFIKLNAPKEAWASTDDGAGLLVKVDALRKQAREVLVSAARSIEPPLAITASGTTKTRTDVICLSQRPLTLPLPLVLLRGKACGLP